MRWVEVKTDSREKKVLYICYESYLDAQMFVLQLGVTHH